MVEIKNVVYKIYDDHFDAMTKIYPMFQPGACGLVVNMFWLDDSLKEHGHEKTKLFKSSVKSFMEISKVLVNNKLTHPKLEKWVTRLRVLIKYEHRVQFDLKGLKWLADVVQTTVNIIDNQFFEKCVI